MSDYRTRYGYIAALLEPASQVQKEALSDDKVGFNYEGTLIYWKSFDKDYSDFGMLVGEPEGKSEFWIYCVNNNIPVMTDSIKPYLVTWYDGADCPLDELTLDNFNGGL